MRAQIVNTGFFRYFRRLEWAPADAAPWPGGPCRVESTPRSSTTAAADQMYYTRRSDLRIQQVDEELLVLDDENGYIHQLNPTASVVWQQCDGKSSIAEIAKRLSDQFEVEESVATTDVRETIERLRELNLLEE